MPAFSVTVPRSIEEFRRIANAFNTGSRFPAGTPVYVVLGRTGALAIVDAGSTEAESQVTDALGRDVVDDPPERRRVYQVDVPEEDDDANRCVFVGHGGTNSTYLTRTSASDPPPDQASLGDIQSMQLSVTWTQDRGTSLFTVGNTIDAAFITQGAIDTFCVPAYQVMTGSRYTRALRQRLRGS